MPVSSSADSLPSEPCKRLDGWEAQVSAILEAAHAKAAAGAVPAPQRTIRALGRNVPVDANGVATLDGKSLVLREIAISLDGRVVGVVIGGELRPLRNMARPK